MKFFSPLSIGASLLACAAVPALGAVTVSSPGNASFVTSPFTLTASASSCSGQATSTMGYSLDSSASTTVVNGAYIQESVSAGAGGHTLHVKSWGTKGASCVADVAVTVTAASSEASSGEPSVGAPANGSTVTSPFTLSASASSCSGQTTSAMGYSLDGSSSTAIVDSTMLSTSVSTGTGGHTVHVKAWGDKGASCDTDVAVTVSGTSSSTPSDASNLSSVQTLGWSAEHDSGTQGSSSGWTGVTGSPSRSGSARQFSTSYSYYGGERYSVSLGDDISATNFVYDAWLYIQNSSSDIANVEMDLNQVIGNGQVVIFGFQCDGWSGTWDYTANKGSPSSPNDEWIHSGAKCNPRSWSLNTWHHVQIAYSRNGGTVTYQYVTLDGDQQNIYASVSSLFDLGWGPMMSAQVQIDGQTSGSGSSNVYLDDLTISRW